ncbi:MAG: hypothetical protein ACK2T7_00555 [Anaerolineales bacterium]|jgi:hypothetical protein
MSENEMDKVKSNRTPLLLLILVLVIVAAAAAYFFLIRPGQTPADTESLLLNIDELVLRPKDLPGTYNTETSTHYTNAQIVNVMGAALGKTYAIQTGRVDGWQVYYVRSSANQLAPEFIFNRTEVFENTQGASLALSDEFFQAYTDEDKAPDQWLDRSCSYGQECILYSYREVKAGAGVATVRIDMAFRYKNVLIWMYVKGQEGEATEQQLFDFADILINRIDDLNK